MKPAGFLKALVCLFAVSVSGVASFAQTTGTLRGTVKDPSGAVIPGATVTATQEGTNVSRKTQSDQSGDTSFLSCRLDAMPFRRKPRGSIPMFGRTSK